MSLELLAAGVPLEPTSHAQEMLPFLASVSHYPGEGGAMSQNTCLEAAIVFLWLLMKCGWKILFIVTTTCSHSVLAPGERTWGSHSGRLPGTLWAVK